MQKYWNIGELDVCMDDSMNSLPCSAFSNVIRPRNLDASPPPSPASSMSSVEDTSGNSADTSLNTTPKTPLGISMHAFPTPPSGGSTSMIPMLSNSFSPDGKLHIITNTIISF